ncbi:MAG: ABC transporter permease, partial [Lachnospiraceae bacterium]|nr:ABC transporter permease [Lachnospiraceae bacterium]
MAKYIVKRIALAVVSLFLICFITFFAMNAVPGGPFNGEKAKSAAVLEALNEKYGLNKPLPEQFINYMRNILHGDFGVSLTTNRDIAKTIGESFAVSAKLGGIAIIVALIFGVILGAIAALNRNKWPDHLIIFFVTLFTAMPSFVAASFLLLVFCIQLQ